MASRVLIVDGSADDRARAAGALVGAGYEVESAPDGIEGFEQVLAQPCDLVIADAHLDRLDGPALLSKMRSHGVKTPVVVWTSMANQANLKTLLELGIADYADKAAPLDVLLTKVATLNSAARTVAAKVDTGVLQAAPPSSGGVLIIDDQEKEHQALRALLPAGMRTDTCRAINDGFAHAHGHAYDMVLFNADTALTNLTGTIAQLHTLLPDAAVVGTATLGRNQDPARLLKDLDDMGFDDAMLKPFAAGPITLALDRYCSRWEDLVRISDDVLIVSRRRCRKEQHERYTSVLTNQLKAAVHPLLDACYERVIVDVSLVDGVLSVDVAEALQCLLVTAKPLGLAVRCVAGDTMTESLRRLEQSFGWPPLPLFDSIEAARSGRA